MLGTAGGTDGGAGVMVPGVGTRLTTDVGALASEVNWGSLTTAVLDDVGVVVAIKVDVLLRATGV